MTRERGTHLSRSSQNHIGSEDPDALKIPARRAESTLTENARSPFQAEPGQFPFKITFSWLDGRDAYQLSEVKVNVPIDAARFNRPSR